MLIDFRDSYFTSNPFDDSRSENRLNGNGIHLFAEHNPSVTIGTSSFNKRWIKDCYGAQYLSKFEDESVVCSGSTIGSQASLLTYLTAMVFQFDAITCTMKGADQGFHNYLIYSGTLKGIVNGEVEIFKQGEGTINNLAALRDKTLVEWGIVSGDNDMVVKNWDGSTSVVVHQYDRDAELKKWRQAYEKRLLANIK